MHCIKRFVSVLLLNKLSREKNTKTTQSLEQVEKANPSIGQSVTILYRHARSRRLGRVFAVCSTGQFSSLSTPSR